MAAARGAGGRFAKSTESQPKVHAAGGAVLAGPTRSNYAGASDGLPRQVPDGYIRVYATRNVLGLAANHWGDVSARTRDLDVCLRKGLVKIEGPLGDPMFARIQPRACCGRPATPDQH